MSRFKVKELVETCSGCPSAWAGSTVDGRKLYIRFRWGYLTIDVDDKQVFCEFCGKEEPVGKEGMNTIKSYYGCPNQKFSYVGVMDYSTMASKVSEILD